MQFRYQKTPLPKFATAIASLAILSTQLGAQYTYLGSGNWDTAANWSHSTNNGEVPGTNLDEQAVINGGSTVTLDSEQSSIRAIRLEGGAGTATLNINEGAALNFTTSAPWDSSIGRAGIDGVVNQSGGFVQINYLELGRDNGRTGEYHLSDGTFLIPRGTRSDATNEASLIIGTDDGNSAGGTATGLFEISGGSFRTTAGVWLGGTNGTADAIFRVLGSDASIGIGSNGNSDGNWVQNPGTTLSVGVDSGGVSTIFIDDNGNGNNFATFEEGSILDVDYHTITEGGGTWTVLELENGEIEDNGLAFAPGVDTSIWSFTIDNTGANGRLTVTAIGDPIGHAITIGNTQQQQMRYGIDYERLWFWNRGLRTRDDIANWSMIDTDVDYIRVAINSGYELEEGVFDIRAYENKILPMMRDMQEANPNVKFFASPRPLNEAYPGVANIGFQPYPIWITGISSLTARDYDFQWLKCAEYLERYLLLMKENGFKISFLDLTNEWQNPGGNGRIDTGDARDIVEYLNDKAEQRIVGGLVPEDIPKFITASTWNYDQGTDWINSLRFRSRIEAVDIASSHNTVRPGNAQIFADAVRDVLGPDVEIWNTELHEWKSTSGFNETTSFYFYLEAIRAGFSGINGWLAIGQRNQGHSYILNQNGTQTRNVKHYIYSKLSSTSNYGYALDILEEPQVDVLRGPQDLNPTNDREFFLEREDDDIPHNVAAFIKGNLMTVWVVNENPSAESVVITTAGHTIGETTIRRTRWTDPDDVEGFESFEPVLSSNSFSSSIPGESVCCFEIVLDTEDFSNDLIQAEDYSHQRGTTLETGNDGEPNGQNIANVGNGDFTRYGQIALVDNSTMTFRVGRRNDRPEGFIEIREGAADGALLGRVAVPGTGGWQNYVDVSTTLDVDAGIYNLYLCFAEDAEDPTNGSFVNLNSFTVNEIVAPEIIPVAVEGLTATPVDSTQIDLSWEVAADASGYNLSRADSTSGPFSSIASGLTQTSFADAGLAPFTTYYYLIAGDFEGEVGPDSVVVSARTSAEPIVPANLEIGSLSFGADAAGESQLTFTIEETGRGQEYQVYSSETLLPNDWERLGPVYSGTGGLLELDVLIDYEDPENERQFFRVEVSILED